MQIQEDKPYDDINITPMLDLAYVLLVIFILMCTATVQGLQVKLPRGGAKSTQPSKNKPVAIVVTDTGAIEVDNRPMALEALRGYLAQAKVGNPQLQVVVKGAGRAKYESVVQVLDAVSECRIEQVGLTTGARK